MPALRDQTNDDRLPALGAPGGTLEVDQLPLEDDGALAGLTEDTPIEEQADGSAVIRLPEDEEAEESEFGSNLAETLFEAGTLGALATELIEQVERDKESRSKRDEQYAEGIRRTGVGNEAPGGADFAGASKAVHPALLEGCVDFAARAMKELFPASGPCKSQIIGKVTKAKQEKADRKKEYMNWQFTTQISEYRAELEQTLSQVPLGGSQFMKAWYDDRFERPRVEFVPIDDTYIPFAATDFYSAARQTHAQRITQDEYEQRVESGLYVDAALGEASAGGITNVTAAEAASDKIEGREEMAYNEDGLREIYEIYCYYTFEEDTEADGKRAPYIITVDVNTAKVLAVYRNWAEEDEKRMKLDWIVEFGFIPWRGAYKLGLAQLIGGLAGAMTGSLRALLDSALINTIPAGLRLKGARISGQSIVVNPTELTEIEGPANCDDIRKVAMPFPFNPPSMVLFELLQWLSVQAKGVVGTAEEKIADIGANAPVGTALAMIEQGSITYTSIHSRLHESQKRMMSIIHRIDGATLDDEVTVEELGDLVVRREDFQGPMDVIPVSDPNIFSDTQRYAQNQAALQLAAAPMFTQMFKLPELLKRSLALLKYPDYESVLAVPADPKELDAISENVEAHKPEVTLKAYPLQDHLAHIKVHLSHVLSPVLCANPMMAMPAMPKLLEHCKEHLLALYAQHALAAAEAVETVSKAMGSRDDAQAEAVVHADQQLVQELGQLLPLLEKAQQTLQQLTPPPQQDPVLAKTQMELKAQAEEAEKERQFKATQATQEQSAANARHDEEMAVATENQRAAERTEELQRDLTATLAEMKEQYTNQREADKLAAHAQREADKAAAKEREAEMKADYDHRANMMNAAMEQQRADSALLLEQLRGENAQTVAVLTQVLQAVTAAEVPAGGGGGEGQPAPKMPEPGRLAALMTGIATRVQTLMGGSGKPPSV